MIRKPDELELKKFMKQIYNPMYYNVKPRFKKRLDIEERLKVRFLVDQVYNPKIMFVDRWGLKKEAEQLRV